MIEKEIQEHNKKTAATLKRIASSPAVRKISRLSLPQIEGIIQDITPLLPGNDLPTFILRGLTSLPGKEISTDQIKKDTSRLLSAGRRLRQLAVFGTFFAGPAAAILLYQKLLLLAGKTTDLAFPEGYWQFYVDYALREDTARHVHETRGFDDLLSRHNLELDEIDRQTAWVMGAIEILHDYPLILRNEWREKIYLQTLADVVGEDHQLAERVHTAVRSWPHHRPYRRGPDVLPGESYPLYRQRKFDDFISVYLSQLNKHQRQTWLERVQTLKSDALPAFQKQMSIAAGLKPGEFFDQRISFDLKECYIGFIHRGHLFFISLTRQHTGGPPDVTTIRSQIAEILNRKNIQEDHNEALHALAGAPRSTLHDVFRKVDDRLKGRLQRLLQIPVLINADIVDFQLPLAQIRRGARALSCHPVTIFDTGRTKVFDLSHIFFDGLWGAAFAEIATAAATAWAVYLHTLPPIHPPVSRPERFKLEPRDNAYLSGLTLPKPRPEAAAETEAVHLRNLLALRRVFKLRNDLIRLTVNDILVLYRSIHAFSYRPDPSLVERVKTLRLRPEAAQAAELILAELRPENRSNPTMLIPVDATRHNPRDRVFPLCFQVPVRELGLIKLHQTVIDALDSYRAHEGQRGLPYERFDKGQRQYLGVLAGLGVVFAEAKLQAARGETISVHTLKLLAHLPRPVQHLLDRIPNRIDLINHYIKGEEVFSNIGVVSTASSLTRFLSAKDDNPGKRMAWGVLTDADLNMRITLRDFRPHVTQLFDLGEEALAHALTVDYLQGYTRGLNIFVNDLRRMTMASRETRLAPETGIPDVHPV